MWRPLTWALVGGFSWSLCIKVFGYLWLCSHASFQSCRFHPVRAPTDFGYTHVCSGAPYVGPVYECVEIATSSEKTWTSMMLEFAVFFPSLKDTTIDMSLAAVPCQDTYLQACSTCTPVHPNDSGTSWPHARNWWAGFRRLLLMRSCRFLGKGSDWPKPIWAVQTAQRSLQGLVRCSVILLSASIDFRPK